MPHCLELSSSLSCILQYIVQFRHKISNLMISSVPGFWKQMILKSPKVFSICENFDTIPPSIVLKIRPGQARDSLFQIFSIIVQLWWLFNIWHQWKWICCEIPSIFNVNFYQPKNSIIKFNYYSINIFWN